MIRLKCLDLSLIDRIAINVGYKVSFESTSLRISMHCIGVGHCMAIKVRFCEILFLTFLKRTLELAISCCLSFLLKSDFAGLTLDMDITTGFAGKFSVTDGTADIFFTVTIHHVIFQLSVTCHNLVTAF